MTYTPFDDPEVPFRAGTEGFDCLMVRLAFMSCYDGLVAVEFDHNRSHGATQKGRQAYADRYLNVRHRDNPGDGCTMAALAPEIARATPKLKAAFERGLEEILSARGGDRKEAIFIQPHCLAELR